MVIIKSALPETRRFFYRPQITLFEKHLLLLAAEHFERHFERPISIIFYTDWPQVKDIVLICLIVTC